MIIAGRLYLGHPPGFFSGYDFLEAKAGLQKISVQPSFFVLEEFIFWSPSLSDSDFSAAGGISCQQSWHSA